MVVRVDDDSSARAVIVEARKAHHDARHHCSAFVLGPESSIQRSNDDGEPSGTAGAPMLEVINGRGLSDVVAVVTRYFGGTLLGTGGLVRAYGDAVATALDQAGVQQRALHQIIDITVPTGDAGRLDNQLRAFAQVRDVTYGSLATLNVAVPVTEVESFREKLATFTGGVAIWQPLETEWADVHIGEMLDP